MSQRIVNVTDDHMCRRLRRPRSINRRVETSIREKASVSETSVGAIDADEGGLGKRVSHGHDIPAHRATQLQNPTLRRRRRLDP